ncbi:pilus assembly protein N-terminal domain-containing protein [Vibrio sp. SS-MA-C1-2]|uniref:type II and III secretion system protein family protein n=1 Tax=Vibrio sp. SS-MA-C1-2 TaxID=2908646 RepID=UPI001F1EC165|nr:pilus assembly protein N-terminal domain-containing protein [Vibrio sp. SS-MA-C1-2]UJF17519.1 pilus assembly protein N-terminal domain-containing protein [Vibrio sp. SS-MA-C1-2]
MKIIKKITLLLLLVLPSLVCARAIDVSVDDAMPLKYSKKIGTVFISQPTIADYQIIGGKQLVLFGRQIGQTRLMIYDVDGNIIGSSIVRVTQPLAEVRQELKVIYPELDISLKSVGKKVAIRGQVYTEEQRDDIYALVAGMLGKEKTERWATTSELTLSDPIQPDPSANFYRNYTYDGIIEGLELRHPYQLNVKVTIAEISSAFSETLGVQWNGGSGTFNFSVTPDFSAPDLSAMLTATADDSMGQILAEPNLTVLSGEEASFLVGGEVPIIARDQDAISVTYKEFGIQLDLSAKVLSEDQIRLRLQPEVSQITGTVTGAGLSAPQMGSRKTTTTIELADGQSFMVGGLMNSADIESLSKIPLLGDIPFFGALFSQSSTSRDRSEVVIIATVNLVKPTTMNKIQLPYLEKTNTYERLLGIPGSKLISGNSVQEAMTIDLINQGGFSNE